MKIITNFSYAKFSHHSLFTSDFIELKSKGEGITHYDAKYQNYEGNTFLSFNSRHFKNIELEEGKVYAISVLKSVNYRNIDYVTKLYIKKVSESKEKSLLEKYDNNEEVVNPNDYNLESSDDEEEDLEPSTKPKKN